LLSQARKRAQRCARQAAADNRNVGLLPGRSRSGTAIVAPRKAN